MKIVWTPCTKIRRRKKGSAEKGVQISETAYDKLMNVQAYLAENSLIHPDIQLFVTTSKNKEGINIHDDDIKYVYIESHNLTDIRQMAGRLRNGVEHTYVIVDSLGHNSREHPLERQVSKMLCSLNLNWKNGTETPENMRFLDELLEVFCAQNGVKALRGNRKSEKRAFSTKYEDVGRLIDLIRNRFPYVQYNFFSNKFQYNTLRERGVDFVKEELQCFADAICDVDELMRFFGTGFPETKLHPPVSKERRAELHLKQVMAEHPDNRYSTEEKDQLGIDLDLILNDEKKRNKRKQEKAQPNRALHKLGYDIQRIDRKSKESRDYEWWEILPWQKAG